MIEENEREFQKEASSTPNNVAPKEKPKAEEVKSSPIVVKEKPVEKKPVQSTSSDFTDLLDLDMFGGPATQQVKKPEPISNPVKISAVSNPVSTSFPTKTSSNDLLDWGGPGKLVESTILNNNNNQEEDDDDDLAPRVVNKASSEVLFQQSTPVPLEVLPKF